MISGYSNVYSSSQRAEHTHISSSFPVPFNIPSVLHTLLYGDVDLDLNDQQKDLLDTLRFSYEALQKLNEKFLLKQQEYTQKLMQNPDDKETKHLMEESKLEMYDASNQLKMLVEAMAEMLTKEQYAKLLQAVGIEV